VANGARGPPSSSARRFRLRRSLRSRFNDSAPEGPAVRAAHLHSRAGRGSQRKGTSSTAEWERAMPVGRAARLSGWREKKNMARIGARAGPKKATHPFGAEAKRRRDGSFVKGWRPSVRNQHEGAYSRVFLLMVGGGRQDERRRRPEAEAPPLYHRRVSLEKIRKIAPRLKWSDPWPPRLKPKGRTCGRVRRPAICQAAAQFGADLEAALRGPPGLRPGMSCRLEAPRACCSGAKRRATASEKKDDHFRTKWQVAPSQGERLPRETTAGPGRDGGSVQRRGPSSPAPGVLRPSTPSGQQTRPAADEIVVERRDVGIEVRAPAGRALPALA